jgi:hypothetical protein
LPPVVLPISTPLPIAKISTLIQLSFIYSYNSTT